MAEPQLSPEEPAIQTVEKIPAEILSETTLERQVLSVGSPLRELPQPITTIPTLNALPIELLTAIFKYLVAPAPSASKLNDEPIYEVTQSKEANLKAVSLVSKRCRKASVPFLFHHVRLTLSEFWRDHPGRQKIGSFETTQFLEFFSEPDLSQLVQTLTILVPAVPYLPEHAHRQPQSYPLDADFFWKSIFDKIDPVELLIVAPVQAMGCLTTCYIESGDMKWYDSPFHYLRLRQPPLDKSKGKQKFIGNYDELEPTPDPETSTIEADDFGSPTPDPDISVPIPDDWEHSPRVAANYSALFDIRPWSSILLNEGSFIKVFSSPIGQTHCAPSMLVDLVGCPEDFFAEPGRPLISPTIRSFEYIAIFPPVDHFNKLCEYMPRIDNFYMQLVPRNDILDDEDKLQNVEIDELWQNRNQCYARVLRELFNMPPTGNYRYLREFESGDIADTDAWHMAVEFVKRVGSSLGWKVERDGVFVRNVQKSAGAETEAEPESSFTGSLVRWAFAGIGRLPVSPMNEYI